MIEAVAMASVRRTIEAAGKVTVSISREMNGLHDPATGEQSDLLVLGLAFHPIGGLSLSVFPASGDFRGTVLEGASITVAGHSVIYSTTQNFTVNNKLPESLALRITPGLEFALSGGEAVTIEEASSVDYDGRKVGAARMVAKGWPSATGGAGYLIDFQGKREPKTGDIMTAPVPGAILNIDIGHAPYATLQVGRTA